jgi:hypothetical protein
MAFETDRLTHALSVLERQMQDESDDAVRTQTAHRLAVLRREENSHRRSPELDQLLVNSARRAQSRHEMPATSEVGEFDVELRWPASHARRSADAHDTSAFRYVRIDTPTVSLALLHVKRRRPVYSS